MDAGRGVGQAVAMVTEAQGDGGLDQRGGDGSTEEWGSAEALMVEPTGHLMGCACLMWHQGRPQGLGSGTPRRSGSGGCVRSRCQGEDWEFCPGHLASEMSGEDVG